MTTMEMTVAERVDRSDVAVQLSERSQALMSLLPDEGSVKRFQRVTLQAIAKNPELLECTPDSVISSVMEAATMGLEPTGAIGGAHLVPFKKNIGTKDRPNYVKQAQLIPDYRGVIRLVTRKRADGSASDVVSLSAEVVKEGDEFTFRKGLHPVLEHTPSMAVDRSRKPTTHVYAVAQLRAGEPLFVVMDRSEIESIRGRGRSRGMSPWDTDWDEMARKTSLKRLAKVLPVEPEVRAILGREDELMASLDAPSEPAPVAIAAPATKRLAARLAPAQAAPSAPEAPEADEDATDGEFAEQRPTAGPVERDAFRALARERGWNAADLEAARTALRIGDVDDEARGEIAAWLTGRDAA